MSHMKLIRGSRNKWSMAFSLMFAVQLLASSLCISTAVQAVETVASNHCHESMMHSGMPHSDTEAASVQHETAAMDHAMKSACTHCASPDDFTISATHTDHAPATFLLAYVAIDEAASAPETVSARFAERVQAPPRSSTTLYSTTLRILI